MRKTNKLEKFRKTIDKIDNDLIKIIAKRFKVTKKVRDFKNINNLLIEDKDREVEIMDNADAYARKLNLNPELVKDILRKIIEEAKK